LNARRINDVVADTVRLKKAMQPEAVITGLVARDDLHRPVQLSRNTGADLLDEFNKPLPIAAFQTVQLIFSDSGVLTATIQLFLLNSIARRHRTASSWAAAGGKLFTVRTSIVISYGRECETRAR